MVSSPIACDWRHCLNWSLFWEQVASCITLAWGRLYGLGWAGAIDGETIARSRKLIDKTVLWFDEWRPRFNLQHARSLSLAERPQTFLFWLYRFSFLISPHKTENRKICLRHRCFFFSWIFNCFLICFLLKSGVSWWGTKRKNPFATRYDRFQSGFSNRSENWIFDASERNEEIDFDVKRSRWNIENDFGSITAAQHKHTPGQAKSEGLLIGWDTNGDTWFLIIDCSLLSKYDN